jgi:hypothetical protein
MYVCMYIWRVFLLLFNVLSENVPLHSYIYIYIQTNALVSAELACKANTLKEVPFRVAARNF